jgi:hypothetical protein
MLRLGETLSAKTNSALNRSGSIVTSDRITPDDERGRVLRFRPRGTPVRGGWRWPPSDAEQSTPVDDLAKYERTDDAGDDYRHQMMMNMLTFVVAVVLIAGGLWLTSKLVEIRNTQDCYLSGRRNCAPIALPTRPQV